MEPNVNFTHQQTMPNIWTFSEGSKDLLQKCIDAAPAPDPSNKWIQRFGSKNLEKKKTVDIVLIEDSPEVETAIQPIANEKDISSIEEFLDPDFDFIFKFKYLQENSENNPKLLLKLAEILPMKIIDKIIEHVFTTGDVDNKFLKNFFENLLPTYIKRDNSRSCTDILLKTKKIYADFFPNLLKVVLTDLDVQSNIFYDLILTLDAKERMHFVKNISELSLTGQQFSHNLFNFITLYKACDKTDEVQNYTFSLLKTHSEFCTTDKNYGKLLLTFLQQEKIVRHNIDKLVLENVVQTHKSPFKKPCQAILKELL